MGFLARNLKRAAAEYLGRFPAFAPAELQGILAQARAHVLSTYPKAPELAIERAVLQAWSERAAAQARCYVDLAASTPQLLVLVDEVSKTRRLFPAADLVRMLGPRAAAA